MKPSDVRIFRTKSVLVKLKEDVFLWIKDEELTRTASCSGYELTLKTFERSAGLLDS